MSQLRPITIYRVQDDEGRGPFRPGLSKYWLRPVPDESLIAWPVEFGLDILKQKFSWEHIGCGCLTLPQLQKWFNPAELFRLRNLGYQIVQMEADRILAQSDIQLVFARNKPLREDVVLL